MFQMKLSLNFRAGCTNAPPLVISTDS